MNVLHPGEIPNCQHADELNARATPLNLSGMKSFPFSQLHSAVLAVALCWITGCQGPHPAADYPEPFYGDLLYGDSLISPAPQSATARVFEDLATVRTVQYAVKPSFANAETPADRIMYRPNAAAVDPDESVLFLMDVDSMYIQKYDIPSGELLETITSARAAWAPSAYGAGLRMIAEDLFWVYGIEKRMITEMDSAGRLGESIEFISGDALTADQSGAYVKLTPSNSDYLFHTFSPSGRELESFGILSSSRIMHNGKAYPGHGLGFAGQVISDGSASFVYVANSGGKLLSYDMGGTLLYYRETLESNPFPGSVAMDSLEMVRTLESEGIQAYHTVINVWDDVLYLNTFRTNDNTFVIDAYSYSTGEYLYSLQPPEDNSPVFITADHLYVVAEEGFFQMDRPAGVRTEIATR